MSLISPTIAVLLFGMISMMHCQKIDVAIVIPSASDYQKDTKQAIALVGQDLFEMSLAVVRTSPRQTDSILLKLTGNREQQFQDFKNNWPSMPKGGPQSYAWAYETVREWVFNFNDNRRAKVVIVLFVGSKLGLQQARDEAKKLREKGVLLYVIYETRRPTDENEAKSHAGSPERIFGISKLADLDIMMPKLREAIYRDLCVPKMFCHFSDIAAINEGKILMEDHAIFTTTMASTTPMAWFPHRAGISDIYTDFGRSLWMVFQGK